MKQLGTVYPMKDGRYVWMSIEGELQGNVRIKNGVLTERYCATCERWLSMDNWSGTKKARTYQRHKGLVEEYAKEGKTLLVSFNFQCIFCHRGRMQEANWKLRRKKGRPVMEYFDMRIHRDENDVEVIECKDCHRDTPLSELHVQRDGDRKCRYRLCKSCYNDRSYRNTALRHARTLYPEGSPVFDALKGAKGRDSLKKVCDVWGIYPHRKFQTEDERELRRKLSRLRQGQIWFARTQSRKAEDQAYKERFTGTVDVSVRPLQTV